MCCRCRSMSTTEVCTLCPRLVTYRADNQTQNPDWHNAPAPAFGDPEAWLLIVGLAPGRTGANRTGRVFTGDAAGGMLFHTLIKVGLASGAYAEHGRDDLRLHGCIVGNAVLCAPPGNRPLPVEEMTCRPNLKGLIAGLPRLRVIVTLGDVARRNVLKALGAPGTAMTGGHGAEADIKGYRLINSYHCSRLNLNTGRLTPAMFTAVFERAQNVASDFT